MPPVVVTWFECTFLIIIIISLKQMTWVQVVVVCGGVHARFQTLTLCKHYVYDFISNVPLPQVLSPHVKFNKEGKTTHFFRNSK